MSSYPVHLTILTKVHRKHHRKILIECRDQVLNGVAGKLIAVALPGPSLMTGLDK